MKNIDSSPGTTHDITSLHLMYDEIQEHAQLVDSYVWLLSLL